jgi:hypothetical protein
MSRRSKARSDFAATLEAFSGPNGIQVMDTKNETKRTGETDCISQRVICGVSLDSHGLELEDISDFYTKQNCLRQIFFSTQKFLEYKLDVTECLQIRLNLPIKEKISTSKSKPSIGVEHEINLHKNN